MGSGFNYTFLDYKSVEKFNTEAIDFLKTNEIVKKHRAYTHMMQILTSNDKFLKHERILFVRTDKSRDTKYLLENNVEIIPKLYKQKMHNINRLANEVMLTYLDTGKCNSFNSLKGYSIYVDGVCMKGQIFKAFINQCLAYFLVYNFIVNSWTKLDSAGDIKGLYTWLNQFYKNSNLDEDADIHAKNALENFKSVKFCGGVSMKSSDLLYSPMSFRLYKGSLVSPIPKQKRKKTTYSVWKNCLGRCKYVPSGVYLAYKCSPIFDMDSITDGASVSSALGKK